MWYPNKRSSVDVIAAESSCPMTGAWIMNLTSPCISFYTRGRGRRTASPLPRSCTWSSEWTRSWWRFLWSTTRRCPTPRSLLPLRHTRCLEPPGNKKNICHLVAGTWCGGFAKVLTFSHVASISLGWDFMLEERFCIEPLLPCRAQIKSSLSHFPMHQMLLFDGNLISNWTHHFHDGGGSIMLWVIFNDHFSI